MTPGLIRWQALSGAAAFDLLSVRLTADDFSVVESANLIFAHTLQMGRNIILDFGSQFNPSAQSVPGPASAGLLRVATFVLRFRHGLLLVGRWIEVAVSASKYFTQRIHLDSI